jgi:hypothetical protein
LRAVGEACLHESSGFTCAETPLHRLHLANRAQIVDWFAAMGADISLHAHLGNIATPFDEFIALYTL